MSKPLDIVLVEDNPADVLLMQETLKEAGIEYSMKVLEDGEEAIDYFSSIVDAPQLRPNLVVLDLNLPKKDGHDVLIALRALPNLENLLIVVLTTSENPEDKRRVLAQNAIYVVKPAHLGNLSPVLEAMEVAYSDISIQQRALDIEQVRHLLETKKISRMLLVEDNLHDAFLVQELLKDSDMVNCELKVAEDLGSALAVLATLQIDIILADLGLPDAQGLDALKSLLKAAAGTPLIVLTGLDDETVAEQAVIQGAQDYLIKGQVDTRSLAKSVRYAFTRKRAEELAMITVANENGVLKEILENAPISIARFTTDLRISTCNSAFSRQFHLSPSSIIGTSISDLVSLSDASLWQKVISENSPFREQCSLTMGETEEVTWDMTAWPIQARGDHTKGGIILALNITERLKFERQREDFIASLAHDIRNPLIGAEHVLSFLADPDLSKNEQVRMLTALKRSNTNVLTMLQNLLDIYRYETAAVPLDFQPISIKAPIEAAIASTRLAALENEIEISLKLAEDLPLISADKNALQRMFINLLRNAVKFSQRSGIIEVTAHEENDFVVVFVADQGAGMNESQKESLFKRFGESRSSKYQSGAGTGLGLYLCKQIVDVHKGKISFVSEVGQGTTFDIRFPAATQLSLRSPEQVKLSEHPGNAAL
jgi:signal transduction histidine kinase/CheY-like chemotaxis protein